VAQANSAKENAANNAPCKTRPNQWGGFLPGLSHFFAPESAKRLFLAEGTAKLKVCSPFNSR
jgi:hypothetical protein